MIGGLRRALFAAPSAALLCFALQAGAEEPPPPEPEAVPIPNNEVGQLPAVPNPSPLVLGGVPKAEVLIGQDEALATPPLLWKWARFSTADYFVAGAGGALTLTAAIVQPRSVHTISGGILFDEAARNALRAHSLQARYQFRDASDVGLSLTVTWPFFADSLTTAWWYRGSRDVSEQMALIDLETLAVAGAAQGATDVLASRERPYGRDCGSTQLPENAIDCRSGQHYRSFFSGHATFSFTSAALICVHHFENDLLGAPWDALSCAGGYAVAATTATFRVVSDVHYASDVILGALVGTAVGYGVPLLHYHREIHRTGDQHSANRVRVMVVPSAGGLGLMGIF
ncbi:MAG: phosphatase PAP2 family protein [Pseudomonadota bacterium]